MRKIYLREIRHIVANYANANKSTGYYMKSKSFVAILIYKMIKNKLVECINIEGQFMFVRPSKRLIKAFGPV
jgi:hypothetical protein